MKFRLQNHRSGTIVEASTAREALEFVPVAEVRDWLENGSLTTLDDDGREISKCGLFDCATLRVDGKMTYRGSR